MLETLCPATFRRYLSLTILGPIADGFSAWLVEQRYNRTYTKQMIWLLPHMETILVRRGIRRVTEIEPADLIACRKSLRRRFPYQEGVGSALEKYLHIQNLLKPEKPAETNTTEKYLAAYAQYLESVCGAAASTIRQNSYTATEFLSYLKIEKNPRRLKALTVNDVELFVKAIRHRFTRPSLRQIATRLRCFLRFLVVKGEIPQCLDRQIDTPRVYRQEQLPNTLPWQTVQTLLDSIDRTTPVGLRDFTMFFLMALYGLRASDVVALTLDNIQWRTGKISICQRKTGSFLQLPLTDTAGEVLHGYLKKITPPPPLRHIFVRAKAPIGTLSTSALSARFRLWARRTGVNMPGRGSCHRIRHSYAVFLLRQGTSVKTIGDILGHRTLESTWTYLRLAIDDLRDVPLPVPAESKRGKAVRA